jgi:ribosome-associated protein
VIIPTARTAGASNSAPIVEEARRDMLELVKTSLDDDQAENVVVIDLAKKSSMADYMVVASGRSSRQVGSMAEKLRERIKQTGRGEVPVEGMTRCDWVLVDAGDVIVHLFRPEVRAFYNLEKMWGGPTIDESTDDAASETILA